MRKTSSIELTIVGPEGPLVAGVVDEFQKRGLKCFGPRASAGAARRLQSIRQGISAAPPIPTAAYRHLYARELRRAVRAAAAHADRHQGQRARGRQGRGDRGNRRRSDRARRARMFDGQFGAAGHEVVIEEFLQGEEASFIVMADGTQRAAARELAGSQTFEGWRCRPEHRRMGAYSPAPVVTAPCTHASCSK